MHISWQWILFILLQLIKNAWCSSMAGCCAVQAEMSSDLLLAHCTLAAFLMSFMPPLPTHFFPLFLWKKYFAKARQDFRHTERWEATVPRDIQHTHYSATGPAYRHRASFRTMVPMKLRKQSLHNTLSGMVSLSQGENNMPKLYLEQFYAMVLYCKTAKAYTSRNCLSAIIFCTLCSTTGLVTVTSSTTSVPTTLPRCPPIPVQPKSGVYVPHLRNAIHTRILRPFHK